MINAVTMYTKKTVGSLLADAKSEDIYADFAENVKKKFDTYNYEPIGKTKKGFT